MRLSQEHHVALVFPNAVGKDLQRKKHPRRRGQAAQSGYVQDRRGLRIGAGEKTLHGIVEPAGRQLETLRDLGRGRIDRELRLEDRIDVAGRAPGVIGERDRRPGE
ncbi:MAG: hypothetical protein QOE38_2279 [Thermoleophilaceae bacterium]|nr:hypothetical protein [Thermoleophilaceae bacterium]